MYVYTYDPLKKRKSKFPAEFSSLPVIPVSGSFLFPIIT